MKVTKEMDEQIDIHDEEGSEETLAKEISANIRQEDTIKRNKTSSTKPPTDFHRHPKPKRHHQHGPHCLITKLANEAVSNEFKHIQHKPDCIHHNPNANFLSTHNNNNNNHHHHHHHHQSVKNQNDTNYTRENFSSSEYEDSRVRHNKQTQPNDKSFYLVEYRPNQANSKVLKRYQQHFKSSKNDPSNSHSYKKMTIKFVSQLYFLLHFSAMISLLLHHKSLVTSENKQAQKHVTGESFQLDNNLASHTKLDNRPYAYNIPQLLLPAIQPSSGQQLSIPQAVQLSSGSRYLNGRMIGSFVATPIDNNNESNFRYNLRHDQLDLLVRLVGYWHAKHALQYFLCYLLSSSISILIFLWLFYLCNKSKQKNSLQTSELNTFADYQRARLDCTPVLVGSISLGLIQLIVIGLDIAYTIDWLNEARWPTYLPILQFIFVSLLMQYILSQVAKNNQVVSSNVKNNPDSQSINGRKRATIDLGMSNINSKTSSLDDGLQNIALAHLLVTHILLWLMKLNSISLVQPIEQPNSSVYSTLQVTNHPIILNNPTGTQLNISSSDDKLSEVVDYQDKGQHNRTELESILRRKSLSPQIRIVEMPSKANTQKLDEQIETNKTRLDSNFMLNSNEPKKSFKIYPEFIPKQSDKIVSIAHLDGIKNLNSKNDRVIKSTTTRSAPNQLEPNLAILNNHHNQTHRLFDDDEQLNSGTKFNSTKAPQLNLQHINNSTLSKDTIRPFEIPQTKFKSSLPKRMTAFRQARPKSNFTVELSRVSISPNSSASLPPSLSPSTSPPPPLQPLLISTNSLPLGSSTSGPILKSPLKISTNRIRESLNISEVIVTNSPDLSVNKNISKPTTERPFPSVDYDPTDSEDYTTTTSANDDSSIGVRISASSNGQKSTIPKASDIHRRNLKKPIEIPNDVISNNDSLEQDGNNDKSSNESEDDEQDVDLDALLPPIPNYNDTNEDDHSQIDRVNQREPRILQTNINNDSNRDEAFIFNEAASTIRPNLTLGPKNIEKNQKDNLKLENVTTSKTSQSGALTMQNSAQVHGNLLTFSDYLQPIVQQYYILIIAILFTMWLDSLRKNQAIKKLPCPIQPNWTVSNSKRHFNKRKHSQVLASSSTSNSEISSASQTSSIQQLVAIPFSRHFDKSRMRFEPGKSSNDSKLLTSSILDQIRKDKQTKLISNNRIHQAKFNLKDESNDSSTESLRSTSSEKLLRITNSRFRFLSKNNSIGQQQNRTHSIRSDYSDSTNSVNSIEPFRSIDSNLNFRDSRIQKRSNRNLELHTSSVCSVFCGLLVVSTALIVMMLGIDLLSLLIQCITQLFCIISCLFGICILYRTKLNNRNQHEWKLNQLEFGFQETKSTELKNGHQQKQIFHYLFLLAAYYCGLSTALNLGEQNSIEKLLPQQILLFIQRHLIPNQQTFKTSSNINELIKISPINSIFLFHFIIALKGFLLLIQVTLQTILIRLSWSRSSSNLRQIYTFLMFSNLSLWALDICEQQQHLGSQPNFVSNKFELIDLEGFTKFANSIVTLSHLYHGLVFMQY